MRIWSVVSQKGGSGKTTLLLHLAVVAMHEGLVVSVIDLDPQGSAEQWADHRQELLDLDEPVVVRGSPTALDGMLAEAREGRTELLLIDTPAAVDKSMIYAAAAAHLVIVPTRTDYLDKNALRDTLDYLKRVGALAKCVVLVNAPGPDRKDRTAVNKVAAEFGVAVLDTTLEDERDLAAALRDGKGVTESAPRRKAAKVVQEIYAELAQLERKLARGKRRM